MAADHIAELFEEWAVHWARGERPDVRDYLERAGPDRDELGRLIDAYLRSVPRGDPEPEMIYLVEAWMGGESPLVDLRSRRGFTRNAVVSFILETFELGEDKRLFVKERYHELESGLLDAGRLSSRLVAALASLLGTSEDVFRTWRPRRLGVSAAFRANEAVVSRFEVATPVHAYDAEVDALFLSDE